MCRHIHAKGRECYTSHLLRTSYLLQVLPILLPAHLHLISVTHTSPASCLTIGQLLLLSWALHKLECLFHVTHCRHPRADQFYLVFLIRLPINNELQLENDREDWGTERG